MNVMFTQGRQLQEGIFTLGELRSLLPDNVHILVMMATAA